jgi:hypothetical protein
MRGHQSTNQGLVEADETIAAQPRQPNLDARSTQNARKRIGDPLVQGELLTDRVQQRRESVEEQ